MKYTVTVKDTEVSVEANSELEARVLVDKMYADTYTELDVSELPRVLIYSDGSFGLDTVTADLSNYVLGYYEKVKDFQLHDNVTHEVDYSDFWMSANEFISYRDEHGPEEFMSDYNKKAENFAPMMYREQ